MQPNLWWKTNHLCLRLPFGGNFLFTLLGESKHMNLPLKEATSWEDHFDLIPGVVFYKGFHYISFGTTAYKHRINCSGNFPIWTKWSLWRFVGWFCFWIDDSCTFVFDIVIQELTNKMPKDSLHTPSYVAVKVNMVQLPSAVLSQLKSYNCENQLPL